MSFSVCFLLNITLSTIFSIIYLQLCEEIQWNVWHHLNTHHKHFFFVFGRVTELSRWRNDLEDLMQQLLFEIRSLSDEKSNMEREIENMSHLLQVVSECISTRDRRRTTELTYDETDMQLKKELCVVANIQDALTKRWQRLTAIRE